MKMKRWCVVILLLGRVSAAVEATGQMLPRDCRYTLRVAKNGSEACTIIYPGEGEGWQELAEQIAARLSDLSRVSVPIVPDTVAVPQRLGGLRSDLLHHDLILLGGLGSNRALLPLYARYHTCCDARYPGGEGYVLRTVVRPIGREANVLVAGGSTREAVARGVRSLLERVEGLALGGDLELPYLCEIQLGGEIAAQLESVLQDSLTATVSNDNGEPKSYGRTLGLFTRNAHLYFYTGREVFAERARDALLALLQANPGPIRIADYTLENLAVAWRRVSVSPVFSADERREVDQRMFQTAAAQDSAWWRQRDASPGIGGRHQTTGMLAWWTLVRSLQEIGNPDAEASRQLDQWRSECEVYLDGLTRHYWDDLDDYQSADSVQNTASYCLQTGHMHWFQSGMAARAVRQLIATTDNLGYYVGIQGYGEALPGWERFSLNGGLLLGACAFVYDDPGYRWLLNRFPPLQRSWGALGPLGLHQFSTSTHTPFTPPDWFTGLTVERFSPYRLDRVRTGAFLGDPLMDGSSVVGLKPVDLGLERAFDKLVIRDGTSPEDMFLVLQGHSGTSLSTIDVNAIIRYSNHGHMWLVQNTAQRSLYFKNGVYVSRGWEQASIPAAVELVAGADLGDVRMAASRLDDYRGTTWTRNLITLRDQFALVIDQVRVNKAGPLVACCTWRCPVATEWSHGVWSARQGHATFHLEPVTAENVTCEHSSRPDGATRPTVLREWHSVDASEGETLTFENLLHVSSPPDRRSLSLSRVSPGRVFIRSAEEGKEDTYCLAAVGDQGIDLRELVTDAKIILLTETAVYAAGGTTLRLGDHILSGQGRSDLSPGQKRIVRSLLDLLGSGQPGVRPVPQEHTGGPQNVDTGPEPIWDHPGPSQRGCLIDGIRMRPVRHVSGLAALATDGILPVLRAEPRLSPQRGSGDLLSEAPADRSTTSPEEDTEPVLRPLTGAEFVIELPRTTRISEITIVGDTHGEVTSMPPARLELELAFTDHAQLTHSARTYTVNRETTYHDLYKGHSYAFECYRVDGLDEPATKVHIRVLGSDREEMILSDIQVRSRTSEDHTLDKSTTCFQEVRTRVVDLDADGSDDILLWTPEGDLLVLHADGSERWRKRWPAGLITVDTGDLDEKRGMEVFVSRADRQVDTLNQDGSLRWRTDFRDIHAQSDERSFGDGSVIFGVASRKGAGTDTEVLCTGYWYTAVLTARGELLRHHRRAGHHTEIRRVQAQDSSPDMLAIRSDIPWVGFTPLEWWVDGRDEPSAACQVPNGQVVHFEVGDLDGDDRVEALLATTQGVGMYAPEPPVARWEQLTDAPTVGVGVVIDDTATRIVCGRADGFVFVLSANGMLLSHKQLDAPAVCLTSVRSADGTACALVGTDSDLRCLRLTDMEELWHRRGAYQHLMTMQSQDEPCALAITRDGRIHAFRW